MLSNDVSFAIFGHQTWDLEGRDQVDPPPRKVNPGFQVPQHTLINFKFSSNKICWSTGIKFTLAESFVKFCLIIFLR